MYAKIKHAKFLTVKASTNEKFPIYSTTIVNRITNGALISTSQFRSAWQQDGVTTNSCRTNFDMVGMLQLLFSKATRAT